MTSSTRSRAQGAGVTSCARCRPNWKHWNSSNSAWLRQKPRRSRQPSRRSTRRTRPRDHGRQTRLSALRKRRSQRLTESWPKSSSGIGASGLTSRDDAERDLTAALDELGLDEDALPDADRLAREALAAADHAVAEARDSASAVRRRLTTRRSDIDRLIDRLRDSQRYTWLFAATPDLARDLADPTGRYSAFRRLRTVLLNLNESVYGTAQFLEALIGTAEQFFVEHNEELSVEEDHGGEHLVQTMRPAFEAVLGHRLQETLNSPSIRKALFDGGEVVRIEPGTRLLLLRDVDGREIIAQWRHSPPASGVCLHAGAHRGSRSVDKAAPASRPRRVRSLRRSGPASGTGRVPSSEATSRVADQVVVILPLQVNYEAEIADTTGTLRERYAQRLEQINERGYCAVLLE